ncbi:hypothetical protein FPOAC2_07609 [Fusarium poae]
MCVDIDPEAMLVDIDPEGDTLLILAFNHNLPALPDYPETVVVKTEQHFLCSKKHLTFASRRAARVFSSKFRESSKLEDGLYHWNLGTAFDPEAFAIVLNVIHGKSRTVPQTLDLDLLAEVASIVDDLECSDAILIFGHRWLMPFGMFYTLPKTMDKTLAQLILVSSVLEDTKLFYSSTKLAIQHSSDTVPSFDLPIRLDIIRRIEESRVSILQELIQKLDKLQDDLLEGRLGCSDGCRAMFLGSLLQTMKASKLYPPPEPPFSSLTLTWVIESLRYAQSPRYFSPANDGPNEKHSGSWHMKEKPSATPVPLLKPTLFGPSSNQFHAQNNPVPRSTSGGLFGNSSVLQSAPAANTAPGGLFTTSPAAASGGLFDTPAVPQANTKTATSGGLFGSGTAPQKSVPTPSSGGLFGDSGGKTTASGSGAATTSQDMNAPQKITRHDCRLKDFIDPLVLAVEEKIQGLQLAEFPQH